MNDLPAGQAHDVVLFKGIGFVVRSWDLARNLGTDIFLHTFKPQIV